MAAAISAASMCKIDVTSAAAVATTASASVQNHRHHYGVATVRHIGRRRSRRCGRLLSLSPGNPPRRPAPTACQGCDHVHISQFAGRTTGPLLSIHIRDKMKHEISDTSEARGHGPAIPPPSPLPLPRAWLCALDCPSATPDNGLPRWGALFVPAEAGGVCVVVRLRPPVLRSWLRLLGVSGDDPVGCS